MGFLPFKFSPGFFLNLRHFCFTRFFHRNLLVFWGKGFAFNININMRFIASNLNNPAARWVFVRVWPFFVFFGTILFAFGAIFFVFGVIFFAFGVLFFAFGAGFFAFGSNFFIFGVGLAGIIFIRFSFGGSAIGTNVCVFI